MINTKENNSLRHFPLPHEALLACPLCIWSVSCLSVFISVVLSERTLISRKQIFLEKLLWRVVLNTYYLRYFMFCWMEQIKWWFINNASDGLQVSPWTHWAQGLWPFWNHTKSSRRNCTLCRLPGFGSRAYEWHVPIAWAGTWQMPASGHLLCRTIPSPTTVFPCSPCCQTLSQSRKVCPAHFLSTSSASGNVLPPFALPSPMYPPGPPCSWRRAAAGRFLELIPLASFLPDRASRLQLWLGIPLSGKKNPTDCGKPSLPQRWTGHRDQVPLLWHVISQNKSHVPKNLSVRLPDHRRSKAEGNILVS